MDCSDNRKRQVRAKKAVSDLHITIIYRAVLVQKWSAKSTRA